jgi:unsaturated chondroitin disaccharide hydrolase
MKNRFLSLVSFILLCGTAITCRAQSIWDISHLANVKKEINAPVYQVAYQKLIDEAEEKLRDTPVSVMMKDMTPASGTKHDYLSLSRYYWPDPSKPDGLPYISRDGLSNPELERLDRNKLSQMATSVTTLSLAYYFSNDERYAQKATEFLRVWFLNKDTRMNPNLNHAQIVPGMNGGKGRCYGVIDSYSFVEMLDAVQLLEQSKAFTAKDSKQLKAWFSKFLQWILTSEQGQEEGRQLNNHSVAHDAQVIAYAKYVGNKKVMEQFINDFPERRIFKQIEPDGKQPQELRRTLAFGYSQYNLTHMLDIFRIAKKVGLPIDNSTSSDGRSFYKAMDFLTPYVGKDKSAWPYQQISEWDYKQQELCKDLYKAYLMNPRRTDYLALAKENMVMDWSDRFFLLYFNPSDIDNAFARAGEQLKYAMECVGKQRKIEVEKGNYKKIMPRSVEKDGTMRLVAPLDWCSGFFTGELWRMYQYTKDNYWRQQAVTYTWPLEEIKWHKGSHDVGFMLGSSFGKAYELTHEQSYRDVLIQGANTLITRYNDTVKSILSWSWGKRKNWSFPVIIDNMMNLELLFEASKITGDKKYYNIAVNHANTTMKNHFRADYSSYHVVDYDPATGKVNSKVTHQGIADESVWSRGQAWGLYGFTMCYRYTKNQDYLKQAKRIASFFFGQKNMPADLIPYWDMSDPKIPDAPRDASAAAIMASALFELATYVPADEASQYREIANTITTNLCKNYQAEPHTMQGFLLLHSTGNHPSNDEIDTPISYADYYYLEALYRSITMQ